MRHRLSIRDALLFWFKEKPDFNLHQGETSLICRRGVLPWTGDSMDPYKLTFINSESSLISIIFPHPEHELRSCSIEMI